MPPYVFERITIEVVSAIACFILVRFMVKPFQLTEETRYLGLPLGFGFIGTSYILSALTYSQLLYDYSYIKWLQLFIRAFAFLFLAVTYYFSKSAKGPKLLWNATLAVLATVFTISILVAIINPEYVFPIYLQASVYVRIFNLLCLTYISIHALKSHIEQPDPKTLTIPFGYILLGIGQYSLLIWAVDSSIFAFFAALALRLAGIVIFLFVSYLTFYRKGEKRRSK